MRPTIDARRGRKQIFFASAGVLNQRSASPSALSSRGGFIVLFNFSKELQDSGTKRLPLLQISDVLQIRDGPRLRRCFPSNLRYWRGTSTRAHGLVERIVAVVWIALSGVRAAGTLMRRDAVLNRRKAAGILLEFATVLPSLSPFDAPPVAIRLSHAPVSLSRGRFCYRVYSRL